jgi:hypothetical protein
MCLILAHALPRIFLRQPLTVLTRQTRQAVCAINQPIFKMMSIVCPILFAEATGKGCVRWMPNSAPKQNKTKTFPWHSHLLNVNIDTHGYYRIFSILFSAQRRWLKTIIKLCSPSIVLKYFCCQF